MDIDRIIDEAVRDDDLERLDGLADMFQDGDGSTTAFSAALELTPQAATELAERHAAEGIAVASPQGLRDLAIDWANRIEKARRKIRYRRKTQHGFDGLRIVSEGDSWFQYPFRLEDVIDHLSEDADKAIYSLGEASDLVASMADRAEHVAALQEIEADAVLLSAGGNDVLGAGRLQEMLVLYSEGAAAADLIDEAVFGPRLAQIEADYRRIVDSVVATRPRAAIFGHAYDLPYPREGDPKLGAPLATRNIPLGLGRDVLGLMLDRFADVLRAIEADVPNFHFVDVRGAVGASGNSWFDELHPWNPGYGRVAQVFRGKIAEVMATASITLSERGPVQETAPADVVPQVPDVPLSDEPAPVSAATYSETPPVLPARRMAHERAVAVSSFDLRRRMAAEILTYEARRENGKLAVHYLHSDDGGGAYEVAGINVRYHPTEANHLVQLIEAGRHDAAEDYAIEYIAGYTDRADRWCQSEAVEFYLRDCMFNRGPGGSAWIAQKGGGRGHRHGRGPNHAGRHCARRARSPRPAGSVARGTRDL